MPEAKGRQSQILCGPVCLCLSEYTGLILFKWQAKVWGRSRSGELPGYPCAQRLEDRFLLGGGQPRNHNYTTLLRQRRET